MQSKPSHTHSFINIPQIYKLNHINANRVKTCDSLTDLDKKQLILVKHDFTIVVIPLRIWIRNNMKKNKKQEQYLVVIPLRIWIINNSDEVYISLQAVVIPLRIRIRNNGVLQSFTQIMVLIPLRIRIRNNT